MFFPASEMKYLVKFYSSFKVHWSYITHCCIIWGITYNSSIIEILTTQEKALHIISNLPTNCHTTPIYKNAKLLSIHLHIQYHAMISMFQQQNNFLPNLYKEKFIIANNYHTYNTRNSQSLRSTFLN